MFHTPLSGQVLHLSNVRYLLFLVYALVYSYSDIKVFDLSQRFEAILGIFQGIQTDVEGTVRPDMNYMGWAYFKELINRFLFHFYSIN